MKRLTVAGFAVAMMLSAGASSAATVYADTVIDATQGSCVPVGPSPVNGNGCRLDRSDVSAALGADDGAFYSLGDGGSITLGFGGMTFSDRVADVFEVTFDRDSDHNEAVDVYSIFGAVETFVATVFNFDAETKALISGEFDSVKLVDATVREFGPLTGTTSSFDGFDVDSVGIAPIPLPAAGFLLLGGLAGLGMMRRKKA